MKFFIASLVIFSLLTWDFVNSQSTESVLRDKYDGYGEDWIFMPDGNNQPQVAVLKGHEPETVNRGFLEEAVTFLLCTRSTANNCSVLYTDNADSIRKSDFSPKRPTKFVTHGWKSSALSAGLVNLKNAFLQKGDYNVILVDWEPMASSTFYLGPMKNTAQVGARAGEFIDFLIQETGADLHDIHFLGHSLGAHVAGNAASSVKAGKISRVTGLDPALPGFHAIMPTSGRLDASDADFVDIIHSCGGILGFLQPLGHADFYPNGGIAIQPGCCCMPEVTEACSHGRAYVYYTESIISESGLLAAQCSTWDKYLSGECKDSPVTFMGEHVDRSAKGNYFLRTRSHPPFGISDGSNSV